MPTTVTKTIGAATGRDYPTLQAWNAALQGKDLRIGGSTGYADTIQKAVCYSDPPYAPFDLGTGELIFGCTTDSTHYREITVADGHRYVPQTGTGVQFVGTGQQGFVLLAREDFIRCSGFGIAPLGVPATNLQVLYVQGSGAVMDALFVECTKGFGLNVCIATFPLSNATAPILRNCIVIGAGPVDNDIYGSSFGGACRGFALYGKTKLQNCVAAGIVNSVNGGHGVWVNTGTGYTVENCVSVGSSTADFSFQSATKRNNASSDTSATTGNGSIVSQSISSLFYDVTKRDFRNKAGAGTLNTGVDLSAEFTTDFIGATRSGTWDMGAHDGTATADV